MQQSKEIRPLTGLRGIAAFWVLIYHLHKDDHLPQVLQGIVQHGYMAVDIFFVLSGFVMAYSYRSFWENGWTGREYYKFLVRRIARVWPMYAIMTCVVIIAIFMGFSHSKDLTWSMFFTNILMIQAWGLDTSINNPDWSVSTEFAAYLIFPLLVLCAVKREEISVFFLYAICLIIIFRMGMLPTPEPYERGGPLDIYWWNTGWPIVRCLSEFILGLIAYRLYLTRKPESTQAWLDYALTALIIGLLWFTHEDAIIVALVPFFIIMLAVSDNAVTRFLSGRICMFLGYISYAMYLLHFQFIRISWLLPPILEQHHVSHGIAVWISELAIYASVIGASYLAFRYIEKPARNLFRKAENWSW